MGPGPIWTCSLTSWFHSSHSPQIGLWFKCSGGTAVAMETWVWLPECLMTPREAWVHPVVALTPRQHEKRGAGEGGAWRVNDPLGSCGFGLGYFRRKKVCVCLGGGLNITSMTGETEPKEIVIKRKHIPKITRTQTHTYIYIQYSAHVCLVLSSRANLAQCVFWNITLPLRCV